MGFKRSNDLEFGIWLLLMYCLRMGRLLTRVLLAALLMFAPIAEKFVRSMTDDVSSLRGVASLV